MEFSDVGAHCSDSTCKQQDYLPFKCETCDKFYCLNHRFHGCENKNDNVMTKGKKFYSPICAQVHRL